MIKRKATGTPTQMAQQLGISRRTWYHLLKKLTQLYDFPIAYSRQRQTYYYTDDAAHYEDFVKQVFRVAPPKQTQEEDISE